MEVSKKAFRLTRPRIDSRLAPVSGKISELKCELLEGIGTVLEILPSRKQDSSILASLLNRTDREALKSDWEKIGNDVRQAIAKTQA